MGGCAAPNCTNHSRKGFRMFNFPSDKERCKIWIINCRRAAWEPSRSSQICSIHFEDSQYEPLREGKKKLKKNAVPTLFDVPNPPPTLRQKGVGCPKPNSVLYQEKNQKIHFEENQFELHRQDGWKKHKPNAIPTVFPEPVEVPKAKKESFSYKRKSSPPDEGEVSPKRKYIRKESQESSSKRKKVAKKTKSKGRAVHKRKCTSLENSRNESVQKKKQGSSESTSNSQKENVSPRTRKNKSPCRAITPPVSDSSTEEDNGDNEEVEEVEESEDDETEQQIALLKRENESMKQEISEFEKHNKAMARVILELEKHNKLMSMKLAELDKDNKVLTKKISDLERQNEDLRSKLNCCFSEEQLARMDKMRQLGTIERYIPALK